MVRLIEAMNYRSLKRVRQPLDGFHVLVGPNASGKSTFMDVLAFLSRLVNDGLDAAVAERGTIHDLFWQCTGDRFELAIEVVLPEENYPPLDLCVGGYAIRYEVSIGIDAAGTAKILGEQLLLTESYPGPDAVPQYMSGGSIFLDTVQSCWQKTIYTFKKGVEYNLTPEICEGELDGDGDHSYRVVARPNGQRPIFGAMNEEEFPTAVWLESLLRNRIVHVDLHPSALRAASRPGQGEAFASNGANFPWLIERLERTNPAQFEDWLNHVRTALPDIKSIKTVERSEDRHRYLMVEYTGGLLVPSWSISEGTLCLLALTFLAYQSKTGDVYLVEEPESHIHPLNIEPVMQSLSSVYGGQVLVSTHSPVVLAMTDVDKVLSFSSDPQSGTHIISGKDHPRLRDWKGEVSLGTLFASGVLG